MLDALCEDSLNSCDSNMQEQDWESLGTVVDLDNEIPWAGLRSGGGDVQTSGVDLSTTHNAPLHFSNENQDEFDISWLGTKQKTNGHMHFSTPEAMNDCGFEAVSCLSGLPAQRGIPVSTSPKTLRKPNVMIDEGIESLESSDEDKYAHDDDDDDTLPLIEDDTDSHLSVKRTDRKTKLAPHLYDHDPARFPSTTCESDPPHCGFPTCSSGPLALAPSGPMTLFPLHLFVAAVAEGSIDPNTPERTLSILDQVSGPALHSLANGRRRSSLPPPSASCRRRPFSAAAHAELTASRPPSSPCLRELTAALGRTRAAARVSTRGDRAGAAEGLQGAERGRAGPRARAHTSPISSTRPSSHETAHPP